MKKQAGITLIELMVTMAILVVIASIAIPAYQGYIGAARNTEGWNNLSAIKLAQEEFFLDNNSYFTGTTTDGSLAPFYSVPEGADRNFDYDVVGDATSWVATATGRGGAYDVDASVSFSLSN